MKEKLLLFLIRVFSLILLLKVLIINAQTNPTPHNLSASNFTFSGLTALSTVYPTSMQGWQTSANNINNAETVPAVGDYSLALTLPGIANNTTNGFSLQSSGSGGTSRRVGAIVLALNTTARNNISVIWTAQDLSSGSNKQTHLALQYRVGNTGDFTTIASSIYSTIANNQRAAQNFSITLPNDCIDEPLVQIRWIYYETGSGTTRDPIRLDDISVTSSAMTCTQRPSNLVVNNVTNTTAQIYWTASTPEPASGYDYYYTTSATAPTEVTVPTGNTNSTIVNLTGLLSNNTYYFWVRSRCGAGTQQSKWIPISFTTYCKPTSSNPSSLYIREFQFVGVLNNPPAKTSTYSTGYEDWTSFTPIAQQPQNAAMNITAKTNGTTGGSWKAWVDWNRDGDFNDAGEEIYKMIGWTTPSITFGFIIPPTALGVYRLRIGTKSSASDFGNCDNLTGEYEDYLFNALFDCPAKVEKVNEKLYDGERCGAGSVKLSATGNASAVSFRWYANETGGTPLPNANASSANFDTPFIIPTDPSKSYYATYYVTAVSSDGCETAYRYPVQARIDPNPHVAFSTSDPSICGEDIPSLLVTATGDRYQDVIFEPFDSNLGQFNGNVTDTESIYTNAIAEWLNKPTPYIPLVAEGYEGLSPAMSSGYFGGNFAMINSDIDRNTNIKYQLISNNSTNPNKLLNVNGYLNLQLDFDLFHFSIAKNNEQGYIEVSYTLDASVSNPVWVSLALPGYTVEDASLEYPNRYWVDMGNPLKWQHFSITIPESNFTSDKFAIRFIHFSSGNIGAGQKFYEAITAVDNVRLSGFKTINTPFKWNSAATTIYDTDCVTPLPINDLRSTVCVKPTSTELEDLNWNLNANATFSNGCPADGYYDVNNDTKTWRQPGIIDWNQGAQWRPLNVPDITKCVIVRTPVELPTNTNGSHGLARSVIVKPVGSLIIQPKSSLTIQNHIINEATATDVLVQNDANLIQNNNSATNSANITVRRNANLKRLDYNYWGAPVAGQMLKSFSPNTLNNRFMTYNEADDFFYPVPSPSTTPFTPGTGYAIRADTTYPNTVQVFNGQFVGSINNGVITTTINCSSCTETLHGNNLIANPYPSNIDFDALQANNASLIYRTAYFWTNFNPNPVMQGSNYPGTGIVNNYAVYNASGGVTAPHAGFSGDGTNAPNLPATPPNRYIKVGQGFIVKAKTSGTLTFNNSIRTNDNSAVFLNRQANNQLMDRFWLSLKTPLNLYTPILIAYVKGATNNYELDYDAELLTVASDSFYSDLQGMKLAIQGKYPFANNDAVVLGARFYQNGNYTIGLDKKEGIFANGQSIYLKDNYTGIVTNLSENSYQFNATAGEVNDRFEILYTNRTLGNAEVNQKEPIQIYKDENAYVIKAQEVISSVKLFDAAGRLVSEQKPEAKSTKLFFTEDQKGVFLVEIITPTNRYTKKALK